MRWADIPFRPQPRMLRQFAGLWLLFLSAIAAWQWLAHGRVALSIALFAAAVCGGLLGWLRPAAIRPLFVGCMVLTFPIGWIVSRLILGAIYFGLLTPTGWLFRLTGRDALRLRRADQQESYWQPKPRASDAKQYFRQY